ncbi:MAG: NINE protein [Asgard group archaeon]|nr:NINE protein [Asgard group archaeon]
MSAPRIVYKQTVSPKSRMIALLLCLFLGYLGVHRFYVDRAGSGILYLCTGGLFGIGTLIDLILILSGGFTDGQGLPITEWEENVGMTPPPAPVSYPPPSPPPQPYPPQPRANPSAQFSQPAKKGMKYCPTCGSANEETSTYCSSCGAAVNID